MHTFYYKSVNCHRELLKNGVYEMKKRELKRLKTVLKSWEQVKDIEMRVEDRRIMINGQFREAKFKKHSIRLIFTNGVKYELPLKGIKRIDFRRISNIGIVYSCDEVVVVNYL